MSQSILAKRYAKALFDLAVEKKLVDKAEADLKSVVDLSKDSVEFAAFVANPVITRIDKEKAIKNIVKKAAAGKLMVEFFETLAQNGRLNIVDAIYKEYSKMVLDFNNAAVAKVVSAQPLTKKHITSIEKALKEISGKKITVEPEVDGKIIGGLVVKMGSVMLDASISGKLNKLEALSKSAMASS